MATIEYKLAAAKGRPAGFDYLRIALAIAVVLLHVVPVNYGPEVTSAVFGGWRRPILAFVLPMFFSLSGFLVAGSLLRCSSLFTFAWLRVIRIVPALAVEVTLCALIIGPLFTAFPLYQYFSDKLFVRYFMNIVGEMQYVLPGVFLDNPSPNLVNGQLWTVPWELQCYGALIGLALLRATSVRMAFLMAAVALNIGSFAWTMQSPADGWLSVHGFVLVECFLAGVALFLFRDMVAFDLVFFGLAMISMAIVLILPGCDDLVALPAAYATVFIGVTNPRKSLILQSGDYSYGVYLYGYPIQQSLAHFEAMRSWWISVIVTFPLICAVAYISWHFVEKPALRLRNISLWTRSPAETNSS